MKHLIIFLFSISYCVTVKTQTQSKVLDSIEYKINNAAEMVYSNGTTPLQVLIDALEKCLQEKPEQYTVYWYGYALYKLGGYYISYNKKESQRVIEKAIKLLESVKEKNAEEFVLLGSLISFSINFYPGNAQSLSPLARSYYDKAIELDKNNIRAYYSIARSDYYKPVEFGGGKIVEEYILKALSLNTQKATSSNSPVWGRADAYNLLINFYIREERRQEALLFCNKALQEYPNNQQIITAKKSLTQ